MPLLQQIEKISQRTRLSSSYIFLIFSYFLGISILSAGRLLFYFDRAPDALPVDTLTILHAFFIGLRFDTVIVLAFLAPLLLILPWMGRLFPKTKWPVITVIGTIFCFFVISILSDIRYYSYFNSHLDFRVIEYFGQGDTFWFLIKSDPRANFYLAVILLAVPLIIFILIKLWNISILAQHRFNITSHIVWFVLLIVMFGIGIRGRLGITGIKWSLAYITQHHFVNQLGLNGLFTLGAAWFEQGHDPRLAGMNDNERFKFVELKTAIDSVQVMLGQPGNEWLEPGQSMYQKINNPEQFGFRPNLVTIISESWSGRNTSVLGATYGVTPYFDSLSNHGILFDNFFASGTRTNYGLAAVLCSFPSLPGRSLLSRYDARVPTTVLSKILNDRGYYNVFVYGGDLLFDNMEGFFRQHGYDRLIGETDFASEDSWTEWGVPDHVVFERVIALCDSLPRPFHITVLTLSNHEPFDLPDSSVQKYFDDSILSKELNSQAYADYAFGGFMNSMSQRPEFDSTIFMMTADHCRWRYGWAYINPVNYHIPLLLYSPTLLGDSALRVSKLGSQTDIIPTLMGHLGGEFIYSGFGRDLNRLDSSDNGFAFVNTSIYVGLSEDRVDWYHEMIGRSSVLLRLSGAGSKMKRVEDSLTLDYYRLQRRARYIMQAAEMLSVPPVDK